MSLENFPRFLLNFSEQEMSGEKRHFYRFKSFRLDVGERLLMRGDAPVALTPKAFDVLAALVERSGHLVEKEELLRVVWADSFVEEANIARIVHTLRKTLGEDASGNKFIETVAKKGYRFVAEVEEVSEPDEAQSKARQTAAAQSFQTDGDDLTVSDEQKGSDQHQAPYETRAFAVADISGSLPDAAAESFPKSKKRIVLFAAGFLSVVTMFFLLSLNYSDNSLDPNSVKSIAILPLKPLSTDNRDSIFEMGIAESLIFNLNDAKNLVVRPFSATLVYADQKKDAIAIGREQKVDFVLASNYQISDGKIRVTSELINVAKGLVVESFRDEQPVSSTFAAQDAVTANIGRSLLKKLQREPKNDSPKVYAANGQRVPKRHTTNEEAYRLFLQGRALADRRSRKDAEKAVEYLEQAVRLDPNFALAYATLAHAHAVIFNFGGDHHTQYLKQNSAIEKALSIDGNLSEAYTQLGEMKLNYEWDFDGAERALKKAVELDPNSGIAHRIYALLLNSRGRSDEAIAEIKIAIDLEPASPAHHVPYGMILHYARRYDEALVQFERTLEINPSFRTTYGWLIGAYKRKGEDDKAFELFLRAPHRKDEPPEMISTWKEIYAQLGWRGVRLREIEETKKKTGEVLHWQLINYYLDIDDKEQAIAQLEEDFRKGERGWRWTTLKIDPKYDSIRSDPRFEKIVRSVGLK